MKKELRERKNITVLPTVWKLAQKGAKRVRRSVSAYLEELVLADNAPKKMSDGGVWPAVKLDKKRVKK